MSSQSQGSEPQDGKFDRAASERIFFAQQTIQNACGTQALLSVLLNQDNVNIGDRLQEFKEFTLGLTPDVSFEVFSTLVISLPV
jgi:ubiquitin carboxyl-terminal hydrolase L5